MAKQQIREVHVASCSGGWQVKTRWGTRSDRLGVTAEYAGYIRGMQLLPSVSFCRSA